MELIKIQAQLHKLAYFLIIVDSLNHYAYFQNNNVLIVLKYFLQ